MCSVAGAGRDSGRLRRRTYVGLRQLCHRRDFAGKRAEAMLKTRLQTTEAVEPKRAGDKEDATDTSDDMLATQEKRSSVDDRRSAFLADKGIGRDARGGVTVG